LKRYLPISGFILFLILSGWFEFQPGVIIGNNFQKFLRHMIGILPAAFVLISLFEVWVNRETVEKHLGEKSRIRGFLWAIVLAGTNVGGLYVAFPIASVLYRKGARPEVIFTYLFAATICRIPMTLFEANFLGIRFTMIRFLVSLPLVIVGSVMLAKVAEKYGMLEKMGNELK
jgi:uncharacterized membrane protein YraQ (UPF0718 family)